MSKKNELVISGTHLSPEHLEELQNSLDDSIELYQKQTKGNTENIVQVIFNDFSSVAFVRDLILSYLFTEMYSVIKPILLKLMKKGIDINSVGIEKDFTTDTETGFTIHVIADSNQIEELIRRLDEIPKNNLQPNNKDTIYIKIDKNGLIEVFTM